MPSRDQLTQIYNVKKVEMQQKVADKKQEMQQKVADKKQEMQQKVADKTQDFKDKTQALQDKYMKKEWWRLQAKYVNEISYVRSNSCWTKKFAFFCCLKINKLKE